ncbi:hypothetical protein KT99_15572, partial [Shewanella benthica KT99]
MGGSVSERQGDEKFHLLSEAEGLWPPRGSVACPKGELSLAIVLMSERQGF